MSYRLPMFPLGTVLFPHAITSLHIFEPRYRTLAKECTSGDGEGEFAVVLIERGHEVGGGDSRFAVATAAGIVEALELPDGRWMLAIVGRRRVRIASWLPDDPYPVAMVDDLDDPPLDTEAAALVRGVARRVRRALACMAELGEPAGSGGRTQPAVPATVELADEVDVLAFQLAAVAPLGPLDRQRLLEEADPRQRVIRLGELVDEELVVLEQRLGGG